ncbi:MAG TPA: hypothetical protein VEI02_09525 [Planctomycetota bacterium]|nr:hypothetical protein [Planctomycetota bacterium]
MPTPRTESRPRRGGFRFRLRRRYLVAVVGGVLLGLLAVVFVSRVYNPFGATLGDRPLLVLTPPDADAVLYAPRLPDVLGGLEERPFLRALDASQGFQQFLQSDFARQTGALEALKRSWQEFQNLRRSRPFGLDLIGDVSGDEVALASWAPQTDAGKPDWLASFRPKKWTVLAAVNVLVDRGLSDRFLKEKLAARGVQVEHARDFATLTLADGTRLHVARVRDAVLVGTRDSELARLKTAADRDSIPAAPIERYRALTEDSADTRREVRLLARRDLADARLGVSDRLTALWGEGDVRLLQAALPRLGGDDLAIRLAVDEDLRLALRTAEAPPSLDDLAPAYGRFTRDRLLAAFDADAPFLPASTFAVGRFEVAVKRFLTALFGRREIFSVADRSNLADALAAIPEFGSLDGLSTRLDDLCDGGLTLGFFRQDRESLDKTTPGYAAVLSLRDESRMRGLFDALRERVRLGGEGGRKQAVKDLVHSKSGDADLYELVLASGVVDDPRVTQIGFAVARGRLVVTNWFPSLRDLGARLAGSADDAADAPGLERAFAFAPDAMRTAWATDFERLYAWFDQSAEGWAVQRTTPGARAMIEWRRAADQAAEQAGLKVGTQDFEKFSNDAYEKRVEQESRVRRPEVRRRIQGYLDQFRGLARQIGVFVGDAGSDLELRLALELRPAA